MSYTHLSQYERYQIQWLHSQSQSCSAIARHLKRSVSTIGREIQRHSSAEQGYCAPQAHEQARQRQCQRRNARALTASQWALVHSYLQQDLSPEQAAHRLGAEKRLRVSTSGIYRHIRLHAPQLRPHLRHGPKGYRRCASGCGQLRNCRSIHERPASVDKRQRIGHWEGDTIVSGKGGTSVVATLTERRSRYTLARHVSTRQAQPVCEAIIQALRPHRHRCQTLTLDNGKEFAQHAFVELRLQAKVYFADPHSPWQRGTNENHNGLLRQYLAKGSDLGNVSQLEVDEAVYRLNHRPRKCLGWKTPHEVFYGLCMTPLTLGLPRTL